MRGQRHQATDELRKQVETMAGFGIPQDDIATVIGIDATTLRRHYADQLARGGIVANTKVAGNLFKIATGTGREAVTAAIFWLKTRAGWSEYGPPAREPKPAAAKPLGKKEAANQAAQNVDDDWADIVPGSVPN